jgi:hypothetical protein
MCYINSLILKILCVCLFLSQTFAASPLSHEEVKLFRTAIAGKIRDWKTEANHTIYDAIAILKQANNWLRQGAVVPDAVTALYPEHCIYSTIRGAVNRRYYVGSWF